MNLFASTNHRLITTIVLLFGKLTVSFGQVVVNEVSDAGTLNTCGGTATIVGADWVELRNRGSASANITGYRLYDDAGASSSTTYVFPPGSTMAAGEIRLLCRLVSGVGTFSYGIGGSDRITLADSSGTVLSTTGTLTGQGTSTITFQLTNDGLSYLYAPATPGAPNVFAPPDVVVNEVADKGAFNTCGGTATTAGVDYIELFNKSPSPANISGWKLQDDAPNTFVIPNGTIVAPNGYLLFCQNSPGSFTFGIGGTDTVTLFDSLNVQVSTTGVLLNLGTTSLTYSRRPNGNFSYTAPSPGALNVFFSPVAGVIFINEVANTAVPGICNGQDWIELINTGSTIVNISGYLLHDDNGPTGADAYTFPLASFMNPGEIRLLCGDSVGNFQFGIGGDDTITLLDGNQAVVSTTGQLQSLGTATSTYQRNSNNVYVYGPPSPGLVNALSSTGAPVLNEIAPAGANISTQCGGNPYVEVLNAGFQALNLTGYILAKGNLPADKYIFPANVSIIPVNAFAVFCKGLSFNFSIGFNDTITMSSPSSEILSTTGAIGGLSPLPNSIGLTWSRVVDLINTTSPFTPFYRYSRDATPGRDNVFPFTPQQIPLQPCGVQSSPYANLSDYQFMGLTYLNVGRNPEFSGGAFDGRTCTHLVIGDESDLYELTFPSNSTVSLVRSIPIIGGSGDTEGACFWYDQSVGEKIVVVDERDRSVAVCDIPTSNLVDPLFRDSSNCRVLKLSPAQLSNTSLTNPVPNEGFEGVACDPINRRLYVAQEKSPMIIWSVNFDTGVYEVLFDVQRLPSWTSLITDIADIAYDPLSQSLYVLSQESEVILKSKMDGTLIGGTLNVNMTNVPEGLAFVPVTGDLFVYAEPNETARFTKRQSIPVPNPVALPIPVLAPVKAPIKSSLSPSAAPSKIPVKAPVKAPVSPVTVPVKAPVKISLSPSASPSRMPVKAPVKAPVPPVVVPVKAPVKISQSPSASPSRMPVKAPVKAPLPVAPVPAPLQPPLPTPASIPIPTPLAAPVKAPAAPVPTPVAPVPTPVAPLPTPAVPRPTPAAPLPTSAPVKAPAAPSPFNVPLNAPLPFPVPAPTPCGFLGLSIFCPFSQCGFLGRLFGFCE